MNNTHAKRLKLLKDDADGEDTMSKVNAIFARAGEEYLELIKDTPAARRRLHACGLSDFLDDS